MRILKIYKKKEDLKRFESTFGERDIQRVSSTGGVRPRQISPSITYHEQIAMRHTERSRMMGGVATLDIVDENGVSDFYANPVMNMNQREGKQITKGKGQIFEVRWQCWGLKWR